MSVEFPILGVGLVHGIDETFRVDWLGADDAALVDSGGETVLEFGSTGQAGFINDIDVLDQAADIIANWDMEGI